MKIIWVLSLGALALGAVGCSAPSNARAPAIDGVFVEHAKKLASSSFKDPLSVQFREAFVQPKPNAVASAWRTPVVCGEINGRNSYGAYTGFRRFIAEPKSGERRLESLGADVTPFGPDAALAHGDAAFEADWRSACVGSAPPEPIRSP